MFAIDPCNAQYSFSTTQERNCGVFPWQSYLSRLSLSGGAPTNVQRLGFHAPSPTIYPVGKLADGQRNIFVDADIRSTAESMAPGTLCAVCVTLPMLNTLTLEKLMARASSQAEHAADVGIFKDHLQGAINAGRVTGKGIKDLLMERLHHKG